MKILNKKKIFQKKSLSQVFLKDPWPCKKLVDILMSQGVEEVLEIGPGEGILTQELLKNNIKVTSVEKDERFYTFLNEKFFDYLQSKKGLFNICHADFLEFSLDSWLQSSSSKKAICGNIPYAISSAILQKVIPVLHKVELSLLLVQLEFAQRLVSKPNHKSFGRLSVYTQLQAYSHLEFEVGREWFKPIPKVDSALVSLKHRKDKIDSDTLIIVEKLLKITFSQRRKKLSNSLKPFLNNIDVTSISIDLSRRCDSMTIEEFVVLAQELFK